jgi:isoleucyl-tRNA synthetase
MDFVENEYKILKFWEDNKIFEKTLEKTKNKRSFVFYDGPPFATGLPHYGHILGSVAKDVFPRYKTMQDFFVSRRWGWDCHGLPIENLVEKELGISGKKDIENKIGVEKFNETCRSKVLTYTKEWKRMVDRIGRFVDFDNSYKTMDPTYMESIWWALKTLWDKGLIYEGKKVLMYCPHCETPVSKAEVAMDNSYKDVTEEAVIVKFKVKNPEKINLPENTYILAWTTTPWTLPANVALAVGEKIKYAAVESENSNYIFAEERIKDILKDKECKIAKNFIGKDLVGLEYEPLYEILAVKNSGKKAWYVASADFINTQEGTGVVHTAVVYGEDDYNLGVKIGLPMIPLLDSKGTFNQDAPEFIRGKYFKGAEKDIKNDLESRGLLFAKQNHTHPYPFCWRCDTQLFYNAISAWFINIQKDKKKFVKLNEKINWYPEHLKHGRFLNILQDAPDWNISRNRYWATPLPFWKCECGNIACIGSSKELKEKAVNFDEVYKSDKIKEMDLHKDKADKIKLRCEKCQHEMQRIPEVIDCWVESAGMPFAELHYPFENKEQFKKRLPAKYIAEYIAQTRTWFYYMHVLSILLFDSISFENVVCTGNILNEKGEKLSKSKKNYTDPWIILDQYGADALRFYLMSNPVMQAEDLFFNERDVKDVYNKVVNTLCNVAEFYSTYASKDITGDEPKKIENVLDRWILSKLNNFIGKITEAMDEYNTVKSCRLIKDFIDELSLWYVRRSRDRFKEENNDKKEAEAVLKIVLLNFSKTIASILPFCAEFVFERIKNENNEESVHLESWPKQEKKLIDNDLEEKMEKVRAIASLALAKRKELNIKVRQPLALLKIKEQKLDIKDTELLDLIKQEVNVKEIAYDSKIKEEIELDVNITPELKEEGVLRDIIRAFRSLRKTSGSKSGDRLKELNYEVSGNGNTAVIIAKNAQNILGEINADTIKLGKVSDFDAEETIDINDDKVWLAIKKK